MQYYVCTILLLLHTYLLLSLSPHSDATTRLFQLHPLPLIVSMLKSVYTPKKVNS